MKKQVPERESGSGTNETGDYYTSRARARRNPVRPPEPGPRLLPSKSRRDLVLLQFQQTQKIAERRARAHAVALKGLQAYRQRYEKDIRLAGRPTALKWGTPRILKDAEERLLSFRDILAYYRDERRVYAPPASFLTITQAAHWRRLQTRTAPYPILLNAQYPDQFPSSCKLCGEPGDFLHILLTCPTFPHPPSPAVAVSYWESTMNSTSAFDQRKAVPEIVNAWDHSQWVPDSRIATWRCNIVTF
ncbi:hypothetical protein HPB50_008817 [Hyalomma asiaticum]|uniref:Uncharacterized protein n=1 Tax=Hyalomma asiaticum TaxID=266040 RepID=A0ACB7SG02_HYAAI|nr:hypothetical protein HPB50_008817 [Hyalomma asiaticum]